MVLGGAYDPINDKIYGCKPNTLCYYHEEGHRKQFKSGAAAYADIYHRIIHYVIIYLIMVWTGFPEYYIILLLIPEGILELHAWYYAIRKKYFKKQGAA